MVYDFEKLAREANSKESVPESTGENKFEPETEQLESFEVQDDTETQHEPGPDEVRELPPALQSLRTKQTICAIGIAAITAVTIALTRDAKAAVLLLLSLYMLWLRWKVGYDWEQGRIQEEVLVCTQVVRYTKTTVITCRNEDMVYSFTIPKRTQAYIEGGTYIFWWHEDRPHVIMASQPL